jgi:hypothetical protein
MMLGGIMPAEMCLLLGIDSMWKSNWPLEHAIGIVIQLLLLTYGVIPMCFLAAMWHPYARLWCWIALGGVTLNLVLAGHLMLFQETPGTELGIAGLLWNGICAMLLTYALRRRIPVRPE